MIPVVLSFRRDGLTRSLRPWLERSLVLLLLAVCCLTRAGAQSTEPFELRDGDRVVFVGDTLVERERNQGWLEFSLSTRFPDRRVTFRNLGWSADTPQGQSRVGFDHSKPPEFWFGELTNSIAQLRPTVVFLGYGMAASLQEITDRSNDPTLNPDPVRYGTEPMSAGRFKKELGQLMDAIEEVSGTIPLAAGAAKPLPVRFVLLSPLHHEDLRKQRPGLPDPAEHNKLLEQYSKAVEDLAKERGALFINPTVNVADVAAAGLTVPVHLTDNGIHPTEEGYKLLSSGIATSLGWGARSQPINEQLRREIIRKNDLFFYRWRPANETYLFGFRKHEQGQNAIEIPKFDPLIAQVEERIVRLTEK